jgi:hypothetical protein
MAMDPRRGPAEPPAVFTGPRTQSLSSYARSETRTAHSSVKHAHYFGLSGPALRAAIGLTAGLCFVYDRDFAKSSNADGCALLTTRQGFWLRTR